jgi:hypothetical protein
VQKPLLGHQVGIVGVVEGVGRRRVQRRQACWNLSTDRSHQTRRTNAVTKLSPRVRVAPSKLFSLLIFLSSHGTTHDTGPVHIYMQHSPT